jgi:DNA-binding LacI/PurR family transcriptional regulator
MDPLLHRPSLVTQVADVLRQGMAEKRWGERMPGERRLCVQLGISRPTLRKALSELRGSGLLKVEQGKRSRPTGRAAWKRVQPELRTVLALTPESMEKLPAGAVFVLDQVRSNLAEAGIRLEVCTLRPARRAQPGTALQTLLAAERPAACLLYQAESTVHRWFREADVPAVVFGTQDTAFPLPALDLDQRATCRHAVQMFRRAGFAADRIGLVIPKSEAPGHTAMREGFREALDGKGHLFDVPLEPTSLPAAFDRILTQIGKPLALVFARAGQAVAALGHYGMRRQLRVPSEVALISLADDPFLRFVQPALARYERDDAEIARQLSSLVVRSVGGARLPSRMTRLMPEFVRGETVP